MEQVVAFFAICAVIVLLVFRILRWARPRRFRRRFNPRPYVVTQPPPPSPAVLDSADQLRDVMAASFSRRKIMSLDEFYVFKATEDEVRATGGGLRVFAQTSLGEVIRSDDKRAHGAINSKRVDILVVSAQGYPLVAVEYQGAGHYQNGAAARDAVKKEALRKAGVEYVEVTDRHSDEERRALVRGALLRASPPAASDQRDAATK